MDERTVIARLGALRAPDVEPSRERAAAAIVARLGEAGPARRDRGPRLVGLGAESLGAPRPAPSRPRLPRGRRLLAPVLAAACLAAAIVAVASLGGGPAGPPTPAYGAELVRFARSTPLLLLEQPGWRVTDVIEDPDGEGQMNFAQGDGKDAASAELNWRDGSLGSWLADRAASSDLRTSAPVLGTVAHVFRYRGGDPGHREFTALWKGDGRVLEFRSAAADPPAFARRLAALRRVGSARWLAAMPPKVIKAADHGPAVAGMLRGIPLPAGFHAAEIPDAGITTDRYQLGAAVAGTVACRWFAQWGEDLGRGDTARAAEAEKALAGAKGWPILKQMEASGAYPQILDELAAEMPSRAGDPRALLGRVWPALGCAADGVRLPGAPRATAAP